MDLRQNEVSTLLKWLPENLSITQYKPLIRDEVATAIGVRTGTLQRVFFELIDRGYLLQNGQKGNASYQLSTEFPSVTTQELIVWIQERTHQAGERRKERLSQAASNSADPVATSPLFDRLPAEPVATPATSEEATEPTPALTPMQQLLVQVQQIADQESKREKMNPDELASVEARLNSVESQVSKVASSIALIFQQAAVAIQSLNPAQLLATTTVAPTTTITALVVPNPEPPSPPTTRSLLVRMVNSYAAATGKTEHETWRRLYGYFDLKTGFNVYAHAGSSGAKNSDQTYLTVVEAAGKLDSLFSIAKRALVVA